MKKTLIALFALAGTTMAETIVFDFGRTDDASYKTDGAIIIGTGSSAYRSNLTASGALTTIAGNYSYEQQYSGGNYANSATLTTDEENGWKNHLTAMPGDWATTFADGLTSQWDGSSGNTHTLTLTNLAAGYYDFSILGGYYGKDNLTNSITLALVGTDIDLSQTTWSAYDIAGDSNYTTTGVETYTATLTNGSANEGYTYDVSNVYVEEGATLTLTLTGDTNAGHRTPLNGLKMTYTAVPEPATASLSLLGLAALMIRRRR